MARAAGNGWIPLGVLAGAVVLQPPACAPDESPGALVDAGPVLADLYVEVIEPALQQALETSEGLVNACAAWQDGSGTREQAQQAWGDALFAWQQVEVMQIGPLGSSLDVVGGQDWRDEVYSWPTINHCRVDQEVTEVEWDADSFFEDNLVNVYGFDALEFLLFAPDDTVCPSQVGIDSAWDALGVDGLAANRGQYAHALAVRLVDDIGASQRAWQSFAVDLQDEYETDAQGLNAIFDALFYLETASKDAKLGRPLGLIDGCVDDTCLDEVETNLSGLSHQWIAANLLGFRALFTGGNGVGLDDLLVDLGEEDLKDAVLTGLDDADGVAASMKGPVGVDAHGDALYDAVKVITDLLRGDVATVLQLQIPSEAAGDND